MTDPVPFLRGSDHPLYQAAADEIERLRATNHVDLVLPPFGHAFTIPTDRLDMESLKWMRENCVIVTKAEWDRLTVQPDANPWDRECVRCGQKWRQTPQTPSCPRCERVTDQQAAARREVREKFDCAIVPTRRTDKSKGDL
jgi:hypothetical protein